MDMTQLAYFTTIARYNSLTKAAATLHVTQPAMSAMLKKFEEELGVQLFDRTANRIQINAAGETALVYAERILRDAEQMKAAVQAQAARCMSLRVAFCDPGIQWYCVPAFSAAVSDMTLVPYMYGNDDAAALLTSREFDVVISPGSLSAPEVYSVPFLPDQVYLSVPKTSRYATMKSISLRDLDPGLMLFSTMGGYFLQQQEALIRRENPGVTLIKNDWIITQQLIRTTDWLATSSTMALLLHVRNDGEHRTLIPVSDAEQKTTYYINCLEKQREKAAPFLRWAEQCRKAVKASIRQITERYGKC